MLHRASEKADMAWLGWLLFLIGRVPQRKKGKNREMGGTGMFCRWCVTVLVCFFIAAAQAGAATTDGGLPKRTLKSNRTVIYNILPQDVDSVGEMFDRGVFYGRLRVNTFRYDWEKERAGATRDNWAIGLGGSMIYKTGFLHGLGMTAGLYVSESPWRMDDNEVGYLKSGKDVLCRHSVATGNGHNMAVLAQAFIQYRSEKNDIRVGRQIFESLLTASNDTKMIPNTFEGVSVYTTLVPDTSVRAALLTRQKLRDHTSFHHVLAYGDDVSDPFSKWSENDDSAMHKGLTLSRLDARGIDDRLVVAEIVNKSIPDLSVMANCTMVPKLVWTGTGEANYSIDIGHGIRVVPGVRYLRQFDRQAGEIGGASIAGKITPADNRGYDDPYSMDGSLIAARIKVQKGADSFMLGWSRVSDDADIIAPWRGFPTGGYTRAMGRYNWYAGTRTVMVQAGCDLGKHGVFPGLGVMVRYALQDFDDAKPDVSADSRVLTIDLIQRVSAIPGLEFKARVEIVRGENDAVDMNGAVKPDPSCKDYRLEANYLF